MEGAVFGSLPPDVRLIETLGWAPGSGFLRRAAHLARLERTARAFGVPWDRGAVDAALGAPQGTARLRVRLTLGAAGDAEAQVTALAPSPPVWRVRLAEARLDPDDPWLRVKTTRRALYDAARADLPEGVDEMLFLNTRGAVCEGAITTIFALRDGVLRTPPLDCGVLPGVLRQELLDEGRAVEAMLRPEDLAAGPLFVGSALRGLRAAVLV